jgi:hypothetical protein
MVACAHLKTVRYAVFVQQLSSMWFHSFIKNPKSYYKHSQKEIASLAVPRKGWQRKTTKENSSDSTSILLKDNEMDSQRDKKVQSKLKPIGDITKPKTPMELDRDWRRLSTNNEKSKYVNWKLSTILYLRVSYRFFMLDLGISRR